MQVSGCRVQGAWFRVQGSGCNFQGAGFRIQVSGCRVQGSGFRVQGSGFRVQGAGFRVQGAGFTCPMSCVVNSGTTTFEGFRFEVERGLGLRVEGVIFRV